MNRSLRTLVIAAIVLAAIALPAAALGAIITYRVSIANDGSQAGDTSSYGSVSADGRYVAFSSDATTLVAGDTNGVTDVFVRDRLLNTTERVSVASDGGQGFGQSYGASISADGRYIAFQSLATTLVAGDLNDSWDVFVHDRQSHETTRASVSSTGAEGDWTSRAPMISGDGRHVAFESEAANLVDNDDNDQVDVFVRDLQDGTTELVSRTATGGLGDDFSRFASISADGRYVAFASGSALVATDTNDIPDVYVRDRTAGTTELIGVNSAGVPLDAKSSYPAISGDGNVVAFESRATNVATGYTLGNIFARDRRAGTTTLVSAKMTGTEGTRDSNAASVSFDGRYIAFASWEASLTAGDTNDTGDVFVRDMRANITERVSVPAGGGQGDGMSQYDAPPVISPNGRWVVYDSMATNLVAGADTNGAVDVFLTDRGVLSILVTRSPSSSTKTYRRSHGKVTFTMAATVRDSRRVLLPGTRVYLQHSINGKTKWHTEYTLTTNASGKASKAITARTRSTRYYRWHIHANDVRGGITTAKQKIVIK